MNGHFLGEHEGGFTPFSFRIEKALKYGDKNRVVVMVDNTLSKKTIPPGEGMNATYFDFFHYGEFTVRSISAPTQRFTLRT